MSASGGRAEARERRAEIGDELIRRLLGIPGGTLLAVVLAIVPEKLVRSVASRRRRRAALGG